MTEAELREKAIKALLKANNGRHPFSARFETFLDLPELSAYFSAKFKAEGHER